MQRQNLRKFSLFVALSLVMGVGSQVIIGHVFAQQLDSKQLYDKDTVDVTKFEHRQESRSAEPTEQSIHKVTKFEHSREVKASSEHASTARDKTTTFELKQQARKQ